MKRFFVKLIYLVFFFVFLTISSQHSARADDSAGDCGHDDKPMFVTTSHFDSKFAPDSKTGTITSLFTFTSNIIGCNLILSELEDGPGKNQKQFDMGIQFANNDGNGPTKQYIDTEVHVIVNTAPKSPCNIQVSGDDGKHSSLIKLLVFPDQGSNAPPCEVDNNGKKILTIGFEVTRDVITGTCTATNDKNCDHGTSVAYPYFLSSIHGDRKFLPFITLKGGKKLYSNDHIIGRSEIGLTNTLYCYIENPAKLHAGDVVKVHIYNAKKGSKYHLALENIKAKDIGNWVEQTCKKDGECVIQYPIPDQTTQDSALTLKIYEVGHTENSCVHDIHFSVIGLCNPQPCARLDKNGECAEFATPLGKTATFPVTFATTLATWMFSLLGGIALIIIIIAGYRIMTSQGDPEKMKGGKEMLTAAITGLLFTIFSLAIYQTITGDILHLPGFGEKAAPTAPGIPNTNEPADFYCKNPWLKTASDKLITPTPTPAAKKAPETCNSHNGLCLSSTDCKKDILAKPLSKTYDCPVNQVCCSKF